MTNVACPDTYWGSEFFGLELNCYYMYKLFISVFHHLSLMLTLSPINGQLSIMHYEYNRGCALCLPLLLP
jgi:hypothetical protein